MKNEGIRKLIAGIGIAAMLFGNVADVIPSIAYAAEEQPVLTENVAPAEEAGGQEVAAPAEEPAPEEAPAEEGAPEESADTPDENAEQPEASDEGQLIEGEAAPEAGEGQTQEPEAAPGTAAPAETEAVTAETDKVGAVHLTASAVDEFGAEIDARYTGMELPASRDVIILNDPENPPYENIRKKTGSIGLIPTYSPSYDFVQATVNGVIVSAVSHEAIEGADYEAWYYRLPDGGYKRFTEDTVIRLEYSSPESYNASYSYADSTLVLRAQLSDPDAVDDAASLVVTPVTTDTAGYSYDAYMQALTACNPALKAEDTLLYDIAFMMGENEVQPTDASVKISLEFLQQQLSKALGASDGSEIAVTHLALTPEARKAYASTAAATNLSVSDIAATPVDTAAVTISSADRDVLEFTLNSFSVVAVSRVDRSVYRSAIGLGNPVRVDMTVVDEFGRVLDEKYSGLKLPEFDEILVLDGAAPLDKVRTIRRKIGLITMWTNHSYVRATLNGVVISALKRVKLAEGGDSYLYTTDGENWTVLEEDATLLLEYVPADAQRTTYEYEDDYAAVTAVVEKPDALPEGTQLKVTPILPGDKGYDAYMEALNGGEEGEASYNNDNTLLYDIAFLAPKSEEEPDELVEFEPAEGAVRVTIEFRKNQLSKDLGVEDAKDVQVAHLPLTEKVKETSGTTLTAEFTADDIKVETVDATTSVEGTQQVSFTTESLSAYAFYVTNPSSEISITPGTSKTYAEILGEARLYGIVAKTLSQGGHMDSNFAAISYDNQGKDFTLGAYTGDKHHPGAVMVGTIVDKIRPVLSDINQKLLIVTSNTDDSKYDQIDQNIKNQILFRGQSENSIRDSVNGMIAHVQKQGSAMLNETSYKIKITDVNSFNNDDKKVVDFTNCGSGTFYLDGEEFFNTIPADSTIKKKDDQTLVFNYSGTSVTLHKFFVLDDKMTEAIESTKSDSTIDKFAQTIIFNAPNATSLSWDAGILGTVIAPKATVTRFGGTASGWLVVKSVHVEGGEWHCVYQDMPVTIDDRTTLDLTVTKYLHDATEAEVDKSQWPDEGFTFKITKYACTEVGDQNDSNVMHRPEYDRIPSLSGMNNGENTVTIFRDTPKHTVSLGTKEFVGSEIYALPYSHVSGSYPDTRFICFMYKVVEVHGNAAGIIYDAKPYYVKVFVNSQRVQTGDMTKYYVWCETKVNNNVTEYNCWPGMPEFTNHITEKGQIDITKKVLRNGVEYDNGENYSLVLWRNGEKGWGLNDITITSNKTRPSDKPLTPTAGTVKRGKNNNERPAIYFDIMAGETITIGGLEVTPDAPDKSQYIIEEIDNKGAVETVLTNFIRSDSTTWNPEYVITTPDFNRDTEHYAAVTINNKYEGTGSLTFTKNVIGVDGMTNEQKQAISFRLQRLDGLNWVNVGDAFTYAQMDGGSKSWDRLEPGYYRIIETGAALAGYRFDGRVWKVNGSELSLGDTYYVDSVQGNQPALYGNRGNSVMDKDSAGDDTIEFAVRAKDDTGAAGHLQVTAELTDTYTRIDADAEIKVKKVITGDAKDRTRNNTYDFGLYSDEACTTELARVTGVKKDDPARAFVTDALKGLVPAADGSAKQYTFYVREILPDDATEIKNAEGQVVGHGKGNVTYDETVYPVVVTVTLNEAGTEALVRYGEDGNETEAVVLVTNSFETTPVTVKIPVKKVFTGGANGTSFAFLIEGEGFHGASEGQAANNLVTVAANGAVAYFAEQTYTETGDFVYTITEDIPADAVQGTGEYAAYKEKDGVYYDATPHTVTVKITDPSNSGELTAAIYEGETKLTDTDPLTITNEYVTGSITVNKTLVGAETGDYDFDVALTADPDKKSGFTADEKKTIHVVNGSGSVTFEGLPVRTGGSTYYVYELDANGNAVENHYAVYEVTGSGSAVTLTTANKTGSAAITNKIGERAFTFEKIWDSGEITTAKHGSTTAFQLLAGVIKVMDVEINTDTHQYRYKKGTDAWTAWTACVEGDRTGVIDGFPKYNESGEEIIYTATETKVAGWTYTEAGSSPEGTPDQTDYLFTNTPTGWTAFSVVKNWVGRPGSATFRLQQKENDDWRDVEIIILSDQSETVSHTFDAVPDKDANGAVIEYRVVEDTVSGYVPVDLGTDAKSADGKTWYFSNKWETASLSVSKLLDANALADDAFKNNTFTFTIKVTGANAPYVTGEKKAVRKTGGTENDETVPFVLDEEKGESTATVTLGHDETVTIGDLPTGTQFIVTETENDNYATKWKVGEGAWTNGVSASVTTGAKDSTVSVVYANTLQTGSLTVNKQVTGDGTGKNSYSFYIKNNADQYLTFGTDKKYTGVAESKDAATMLHVSMANKTGSVTVTGLPLGTYTAEEVEADAVMAAYTLTVIPGEPATISASNRNAATTFTNDYTNKKIDAELKATKTMSGDTRGRTADYEYQVGLYSNAACDEEHLLTSVTLKADQTKSFETDSLKNLTLEGGTEKTYTFYVKESKPANAYANVTYDETVKTVAIRVYLDAEDDNRIKVDYGTEGNVVKVVTVANSFETKKTTAEIPVHKGFEGTTSETFTFTVTGDNDDAATVSNLAAGETRKVTTGEFTETGDTIYSIAEQIDPNAEDGTGEFAGYKVFNGVLYDPTVKKVIVRVTDPQNDGNLVAKVYEAQLDENGAYVAGSEITEANPVALTNKKEEARGDVTLHGTKTLEGREFKTGDVITFTLTAVTDGAPKPADNKATFTVREDDKHVADVVFGKIDFTEEHINHSYTYRITESHTLGGVTTADAQTVTVSVTDNHDGTLAVTPNYGENGFAFVNTYTAYEVQPKAYVTKVLNHKDLNAGDYSFTLTEQNPAEGEAPYTAQATNGADGVVEFTLPTYTASGEYTYQITEDAPTGKGVTTVKDENDNVTGYVKNGVTYDRTEKTVRVVVTDNNAGALVASVYYGDSTTAAAVYTGSADGTLVTQADAKTAVSFTNDYDAQVDVVLDARKELVNRGFREEDQWSFTLEPVTEGAPMPANTEANPNAAVVSITGLSEGTSHAFTWPAIRFGLADAGKKYTYRITESGSGAGVTNDTREHLVIVSVSDNGDGTLTATKSYVNGENRNDALAVFENTYDASGSTGIDGVKMLTGREFSADDSWTFTIEGSEGAPMPATTEITVSPAADNTFRFGPIAFTRADHAGQTYIYTVTETGVVDGVTNASAQTVTVTVTDNGDGTLEIAKDYGKNKEQEDKTALLFENIYNANGKYTFEGSKTLTGRAFRADDHWTFTLEPVTEGAPMPTADGREVTVPSANRVGTTSETFSFGTIVFGLTDRNKDYTYQITESGSGAGVTNDTNVVRQVTLHVSDDGNGVLSVNPVADTSDNLTYVNTYDASGTFDLTGTKTIANRDFKEGDVWSFTVTAPEGTPMPAKTRVDNDGTGKIDFGTITYGLSDAGHTYTYTITESAQTVEGVTNDSTASRTVTVKVEDTEHNGTLDVTSEDGTAESRFGFVNTYQATAELTLNGNKSLDRRSFREGDGWTFTVSGAPAAGTTLKADKTVPMPEKSSETIRPGQADGASKGFDFGKITYDLSDVGNTYVYTITEADAENAENKGITNETDLHTVTVTVTDPDKNGTLKLDVTEANGDVTTVVTGDTATVSFVNHYDADGEVELKGTKQVENRTFKAGDAVTFTIDRAEGEPETTPLPEKTTAGFILEAGDEAIGTLSKAVSFGEIHFTLDDIKDKTTFNYVITETATMDGVSAAAKTQTLTISVTDDGSGELQVVPSYQGGQKGFTFVNTYNADGEWTFEGSKTIENRSFQKGDGWTFTIEPLDGAPAPKDAEGNVVTSYQTSYIAGNNETISLGKVVFTLADLNGADSKTFSYKITESNTTGATNAGITNDADAERIVKLTVTDTKTGSLDVEEASDSEQLAFKNTYTLETDLPLTAKKRIEGRTFQADDEWTFTVSAAEGTPMPTKREETIHPTSGSEATVDFGSIHYTQANAGNKYIYTIMESKVVQGVDNDVATHTVTVEVSDRDENGVYTGMLVATPVYRNGETDHDTGVKFTNTYNAKGKWMPQAQKTIEGRTFHGANEEQLLTADEITFTITANNGGKLPTPASVTLRPVTGNSIGTTADNGFGKIEYTLEDLGDEESKTFTYTLTETASLQGVTNDTRTHTVDVTVSRKNAAGKEDGTLTVTPVYKVTDSGATSVEEKASFVNTYAASGKATIEGTKKITGRNFKQGDTVIFTLSGVDNAPMPAETGRTATITPASGTEETFAFGEITYSLNDLGGATEKTFTYKVSEQVSMGDGMTNDSVAEHIVTVTVTDRKNGTLDTKVNYTDANNTALVFTNAYRKSGEADLVATKSFANVTSSPADAVYTFTVTGKDKADPARTDIPMPERTSIDLTKAELNGGAATLNFGKITYEQEDGGHTYVYTIHESVEGITPDENGNYVKDGVTYDAVDKVVEITVTYDPVSGDVTTTEASTTGKVFTNTYDAKGSIALSGTKTLNNRDFQAGDEAMTFTVTSDDQNAPMPTRPTVTVDPSAENPGTLDFGTFTYKLSDLGGEETKTFIYTVTESGQAPGVTNDADSDRIIKIVVTDLHNGTLEVKYAEDSEAVAFVNTYDAAVSVTFGGDKQLVNRAFTEGDSWTFTLTADRTDAPMPADGRNPAVIHPTSGNTEAFSFGDITFGLDDVGKTYTYTVTETDTEGATQANVDNDAEKTYTVTITDTDANGIRDGKLRVNGVEPGAVDGKVTAIEGEIRNAMHFVNTYHADGELTLYAKKTIEGRKFLAKDDEVWTFALRGSEGAPMPEEDTTITLHPTADTDATAVYAFGTIKYNESHIGETYTYTVTETGQADGVTNGQARRVSVKITDNGDGTLSVSREDGQTTGLKENDPVIINNVYSAEGEFPLKGTKSIAGRPFRAGDEWTFTVTSDDPSAPMPENPEITIRPTLGTSVELNFGKIHFTQANAGKTYTYTITEAGNVTSTTNTAAKTVTIKVDDAGANELHAMMTSDPVTFINTYTASGSIPVRGSKTLTGRTFKKGDAWTFMVEGVEEGTNKADGVPQANPKSVTITPTSGNTADVDLGTIAFTQADIGKTYVYTITETGNVKKVENDTVNKGKHTVTVTVADSENSDGSLAITQVWSDDNEHQRFAFTNKYTASGTARVEGTKTITGRSFKAGDSYTFTIARDPEDADSAKAPLPAESDRTVTITPATGKTAGFVFDFGENAFTQADAGKTYHYVITETYSGQTKAGVTYDTLKTNNHKVAITLTDDGVGRITPSYDYSDGEKAYVQNDYNAEEDTPVGGFKEVEGREFKEGDEISFTIARTTGEGIPDYNADAPLPAECTVTIRPTEGKLVPVSFGTIHYALSDLGGSDSRTFYYTVTEEARMGDKMTADGAKTFTVTVTDNKDGTLTVTPDYGRDSEGNAKSGFTFVNTYNATQEMTLTGSKTLLNRAFKADDTWTFTVTTDPENAPKPEKTEIVLSNVTDARQIDLDFGKIHFTDADAGKTYKYTITESGSVTGVNNDPVPAKTVIVTVTKDPKTGELSVARTEESVAADFVNTYVAKGETQLHVGKTLENRNFKQGDSWSFALTADAGAPMPKDADGNVVDKLTLSFDKDGTNNTAILDFPKISYTQEHIGSTFTYTITETGTVNGVTNDVRTHTVVVTVKDDNQDGDLEITRRYYVTDAQTEDAKEQADQDKSVFVNTYKAEGETKFEGTKTLNGRNFTAGEPYEFEISGIEEGTDHVAPMPAVPKTSAVGTSGKNVADFAFGTITYGLEDVGKTYVYTIREIIPKDAKAIKDENEVVTGYVKNGVKYDVSEHTVTVRVTDPDRNGVLAIEKTYSDGDKVSIVNTYDAKGDSTIEGRKTLTGRKFADADKVSFTIRRNGHTGPLPSGVDKDGKISVPLTSGEQTADVSFGKVVFTRAHLDGAQKDEDGYATFVYVITEEYEMGTGVNGDSDHIVTFRVKDKGDGNLDVQRKYSDEGERVNIHNTYSANGYYDFKASKMLSGRAFQTGDTWNFTLKAENGGKMPAGSVKGEDGKEAKTIELVPTAGQTLEEVLFGRVTFTLDDLEGLTERIWTYTITETGSVEGVTNDRKSTRTIYLKVKDEGNGTITATVLNDQAYKSDSTAFTNTWNPGGLIPVPGRKYIEGREFKDGDSWTFTVSAEQTDAPMPTVNPVTISGKELAGKNVAEFSFGKIAFTKEHIGRTFNYTVTETGDVQNVTNDKAQTFTVTVNAMKNAEGALLKDLDIRVDYGNNKGAVVFTNRFDAKGEWELAGQKKMEGREFKNGDRFVMTVTADKDTPMPEKPIIHVTPASGTVSLFSFGKINFTTKDIGKTYTYTISESKEVTVAGVVNDTVNTNNHKVTLKVVYDEKDGTIKPSDITYTDGKDGVVIVNTYSPNGEYVLKATKSIEGRSFARGDKWTFTVATDPAGAPMPERTSVTIEPAAGTVTDVDFGKISYTKADIGKTYTYTITEDAKVTVAGVTNDVKTTRTVAVTVTGDGTEKLVVTPVWSADGNNFVNTYRSSGKIELKARKTLKGATLAAGQFSFTLTGEGVKQTKTNDKDGNVVFDPITFDQSIFTNGAATATRVYTISESIPSTNAGFTYDTSSYTATVTLKDDGKGNITGEVVYEKNGKKVTEAEFVNEVQKGSVRLVKRDSETGNVLSGAKFTLYKSDTKVGTYTTSEGGIIEVGNLAFGSYYFVEEEAPKGYTKSDTRYSFTISSTSGVTKAVELTAYNTPTTINIDGEKLWDDNNNSDGIRPSSIQVLLMRNKVEVPGSLRTVTAGSDGRWRFSFGRLPKYDENGKEYTYSIVESEITGYTGTVQEATDNGDITFYITNRHTPTPPTTPPDTPNTPTPPDTPTTPPAPAPTPQVAPTARIKPPTPVPTVNPGVLGARRNVLSGQRAGKVLGARRASTGDDAAMVAYGVMSGGSFAGFWAWILAFLRRKKEERQRRLARAEKQS